MPKGYHGESCAEAIKAAFQPGATPPFSEVFKRAKKRGPWKDETIWQHLMSLIVNLPPARRHWDNANPFLFLRTDGQYELYDPRTHPKVIE